SISIPPTTAGTSCSLNRNRVTTPKLPPPPRIAQKRSGCVSASTRRSLPSAVTSSAARRLSMVRQYLRTRYPTPPPSVIPPIPTEPVSPNPSTRFSSQTAFENSPAVRPVSAQAVRLSRTISSPFISDRSSTMPPSQTLCPATL